MNFKSWWQEFNKTEDKLSERQLDLVQGKIDFWDKKKVKYSDKVHRLQRQLPKLKEEWKAERVVRTTDSKNEAESIKSDAKELGFKTFKIMLSPNACKTCRKFTENGAKIFTQKDLEKTYTKAGVPIHPNCSCILIPYE